MRIIYFMLVSQLILANSARAENYLEEDFPKETFSVTAEAMTRDDKGRAELGQVSLEQLLSRSYFAGNNVKVVLGKSEEALPIGNGDPLIQLKAATVYAHMNKAVEYFKAEFNHDPTQGKPIVARLELTNKFSDLAHYTHDNFEPQYNNALSIPAGKPFAAADDIAPWGHEIWYRPTQKIDMNKNGSMDAQTAGMLEAYRRDGFERMIDVGLMNTINFAIYQLGRPGADYFNYISQTFGSFVVVEGMYWALKLSERFFRPKYFFLDTAMIPEVTYHEVAHVALSDYLAISHSTAVIEGYADYFAAAMSNNPRLADRISRYSSAKPKNGKNRNKYDPAIEMPENANGDFVLASLWDIRKEFPAVADRLVFESRKFLKTGSAKVWRDIPNALVAACRTVCESPKRDSVRIIQVLAKRGL